MDPFSMMLMGGMFGGGGQQQPSNISRAESGPATMGGQSVGGGNGSSVAALHELNNSPWMIVAIIAGVVAILALFTRKG